jgi:peptidoglycan/LPS O-acetylase OafA/YrhL
MGLVRRALVQWDRVGGLALVLVGLGVLIAGCAGVSNTTETVDQMSYLISGGVLGLFLLGIGATLWLSADLRDEWRKMDHLQASVDALSAALASTGAAVELSLPESSLVDA